MALVHPNMLLNLSSSLTSLNVVGSGIRGNFPAAYSRSLPNLQLLELSENIDLTGSLREFNWTISLKYLDLSFCGFTGVLPKSRGNLTKITHIFLQYNSFGGEIPAASISNLAQLQFLNLLGNNFQGRIPNAFENLSKLTFINLEGNRFTGILLNNFSGPFPTAYVKSFHAMMNVSAGSEEPPSSTSFEQEDEMEHESLFNWRAISLGYACGIVYGVVMGYFLFYRGGHRWFLCIYLYTILYVISKTQVTCGKSSQDEPTEVDAFHKSYLGFEYETSLNA
ncbi:hypothetical protein FEM48_Zijuj02G0028000 [Ziziphus jujuba var. spinosa]|uniref:Uncharacterized protein n=1 Tax=Ziziphus jujuba var. spinosa TaxID=714518 RepID=A0A978VT63_ZIZJJ|nr:hypothetical protein FEM48_Zijuj02G0028000 [Ziziphus jujuba var. spinosa]